MLRLFICGYLVLSVFACTVKDAEKSTLFTAAPTSLGRVPAALNEASGLVASRRYPGLLWTHNDSGDNARLFLIREDGSLVATVYINHIINRDWEDITAYYDQKLGKYFLYIAEIGDNRALYDFKFIYRIEEPELEPSLSDQTLVVNSPEKIIFQYADGSRDAEALMFDPLDQVFYLVSKREKRVGVYAFPDEFVWGDTLYLNKNMEIPHTQIVAGDISSDGSEIITKDYESIYYWRREKDESVLDALKRPAHNLPYKIEKQGEAIAWALDGSGYFTLSEQADDSDPPIIYFYKRN
ncbi:MAG TPA: hypothetical protein PKC24_02605 [Cyclobacteriaceae bacterium]|nr:hypothetical protein [Cyclobacteriaceae bacterium]